MADADADARGFVVFEEDSRRIIGGLEDGIGHWVLGSILIL
jgi:hypothetical protein